MIKKFLILFFMLSGFAANASIAHMDNGCYNDKTEKYKCGEAPATCSSEDIVCVCDTNNLTKVCRWSVYEKSTD